MKVAANGCQRNCQVSSFVAMILAQAQDGITNLNIMLNAALLSFVGFHLKRISSASFDLKRDLYIFYIFCCVRYFSSPCYRLLPYALARIGCYLFIYSYSLLYCKKNPLLLKNEHIVSKDFFEAEFELDGIESGKLESTSSRYLQHSVDTSRTRKISTHGLNWLLREKINLSVQYPSNALGDHFLIFDNRIPCILVLLYFCFRLPF